MKRFNKFLLEYLTDAQRKEYSKYKMNPQAREATNHFFGEGNDVVHEDLIGATYHDKGEIHKKVETHLGREITHDEYRSGLVKDKYDRDAKIGKMIKDDKLRQEFANDDYRRGAKSTSQKDKFTVSIHRGTEVAGQTNSAKTETHPEGHSWKDNSCKNVTKPHAAAFSYLPQEIKHGTVAMFVHDHTGKEVYRATFQPYVADEHRMYKLDAEHGAKHEAFTQHAKSVEGRLNAGTKETDHVFHKIRDVYDDNHIRSTLHPNLSDETIMNHMSKPNSERNSFTNAIIDAPHIMNDKHISAFIKNNAENIRNDARSIIKKEKITPENIRELYNAHKKNYSGVDSSFIALHDKAPDDIFEKELNSSTGEKKGRFIIYSMAGKGSKFHKIFPHAIKYIDEARDDYDDKDAFHNTKQIVKHALLHPELTKDQFDQIRERSKDVFDTKSIFQKLLLRNRHFGADDIHNYLDEHNTLREPIPPVHMNALLRENENIDSSHVHKILDNIENFHKDYGIDTVMDEVSAIIPKKVKNNPDLLDRFASLNQKYFFNHRFFDDLNTSDKQTEKFLSGPNKGEFLERNRSFSNDQLLKFSMSNDMKTLMSISRNPNLRGREVFKQLLDNPDNYGKHYLIKHDNIPQDIFDEHFHRTINNLSSPHLPKLDILKQRSLLLSSYDSKKFNEHHVESIINLPDFDSGDTERLKRKALSSRVATPELYGKYLDMQMKTLSNKSEGEQHYFAHQQHDIIQDNKDNTGKSLLNSDNIDRIINSKNDYLNGRLLGHMFGSKQMNSDHVDRFIENFKDDKNLINDMVDYDNDYSRDKGGRVLTVLNSDHLDKLIDHGHLDAVQNHMNLSKNNIDKILDSKQNYNYNLTSHTNFDKNHLSKHIDNITNEYTNTYPNNVKLFNVIKHHAFNNSHAYKIFLNKKINPVVKYSLADEMASSGKLDDDVVRWIENNPDHFFKEGDKLDKMYSIGNKIIGADNATEYNKKVVDHIKKMHDESKLSRVRPRL